LAGQERVHEAKLEAIRASGRIQSEHFAVANLDISEALAKPQPSADLSFRDALILAMKREQEARDLYLAMAAHAREPEVKRLTEVLANEEASHKLELEKYFASM
jgi:hypothetical protein